MTDFSNVLLASDYDRTMTGFDGEIPAANLAAVDEFLALGGAFTIATGRSKPMFAEPLRKLRVNAPVILANGAAVWEPEGDRVTVLHSLSGEALAAIREIRRQFPGLRLELQGLRAHRCFGRDALRDAYLERYGIEACYDGWEDLNDTILTASFYAPFRSVGHSRTEETSEAEERPFAEMARLVETQYAPLLEPVRSMPRMIELLPRGCGKGRTARWLAGRLGRKVLYCAGDAPNDLPMLTEADEAFIPSTADPGVTGLGFTEAASCDAGTVASIVALLKQRREGGG